ncbi:hypothetical protein PR202_gb24856 [Eleusine coracana subsp. coracana]|uniref:Late embryogenesis abundant protein LEA-2 subgroup domain-containing protein n=1 Tax=Eleusine coracana subsp. coracana TaxID=191504 RepID=A0AAV5FP19_ELECO|nr:hypothetical protein PR202_gb24856 [Eleusine coracana subsp. coracana]
MGLDDELVVKIARQISSLVKGVEMVEPLIEEEGYRDTRSNAQVNMRKLHIQHSEYESQENEMLQVDGHAQPRLIIRRVNEYYQSISYRTCKVMLYCSMVFTLSIMAILTMAFGNVRHVSIAVESATLVQFGLVKSSPVGALAYNFSFVLTVSNPSWAISIENTKNLEVGIQFDGQQFDRVLLMERGSKLHPLKTTRFSVHASSNGSYVALGDAGAAEFKRQADLYELEVVLSGQVRYFLHYSKSKLEASCPLKLYRVPAMTTWIMIESMPCKLARDARNH